MMARRGYIHNMLRFVDRMRRFLPEGRSMLQPEARFSVVVIDREIINHRPEGKIEHSRFWSSPQIRMSTSESDR
jgi:hypothetical protein